MEFMGKVIQHLPETQDLWMLLRIVVACFCGAVIGLERTKRMKEAGIRTHIIVCCASALLMVISKYAFGDLGEGAADASRIAAQVVSGISFLCAGVIFKNGNSVKGLTTAAGIWFTAAVGLAIGAGMYWIGIFTTLIIMLIQFLMHRFTFGNDSLITEQVKIVVEDIAAFTGHWEAFLSETKAVMEDTKPGKPGRELPHISFVCVPERLSRQKCGRN